MCEEEEHSSDSSSAVRSSALDLPQTKAGMFRWKGWSLRKYQSQREGLSINSCISLASHPVLPPLTKLPWWLREKPREIQISVNY